MSRRIFVTNVPWPGPDGDLPPDLVAEVVAAGAAEIIHVPDEAAWPAGLVSDGVLPGEYGFHQIGA